MASSLMTWSRILDQSMISPYIQEYQQDEELHRLGFLLAIPSVHRRIEDLSLNSASYAINFRDAFQNQSGNFPSLNLGVSSKIDLNDNVEWQLIKGASGPTIKDIKQFLVPEAFERILSAIDLKEDGWYWGEGKAVPRSAFPTIVTILTSLGAEVSLRCMTFVSPAGSIELAWSLGNGDRLSVLVPGTETGTTVQLISDLIDTGIDSVREAVDRIRTSLQESYQ